MLGESSMRNRALISFAFAFSALLGTLLGAQNMAHNIAQYIGPSEPLEVTSAQKSDRIAWIAYERGMRNVYTAAPPDFRAVRLTNFMDDNGAGTTGLVT